MGVQMRRYALILILGSALLAGFGPVNAEADSGDSSFHPEVQVISTSMDDGAFSVESAVTATPLTSDPMEVPFSNLAVPNELLGEIGSTNIQDAYDYVSGVNPYNGYGGLASADYNGRGFDGGSPLRNGYRDFGFLTTHDVANIERVEVLKGPASILFGTQSSPGLQVNMVTKKPVDTPLLEATVSGGSYNTTRTALDMGGPLSDDKSISYRFNAAYENADSHRDHIGHESMFLSPVVQWKLSDITDVSLELSYHNYEYDFFRGLLPNAEAFNIPIETFHGEPGLHDSTSESFAVFLDLNHAMTDELRYHLGISYFDSELDQENVYPTSLSGSTLNRGYRKSLEKSHNLAVRNELFWETEFNDIENSFMVGNEFAYFDFWYDFDGDSSINAIDFHNPVHGSPGVGALVPVFGSEYGAENVAVYWQDLVTLIQDQPGIYKFNIMAGGRYDHFLDTYYQDLARHGGAESSYDTDGNYTSQAGMVYQPVEDTSLYVGWSESFERFSLFSGIGPNNEQADFERGTSIEWGVKQEFFEDRLSANLNFFHTKKTDVITDDPLDPNLNIQVGEQRSKGVELDIVGEITPGWNAIAYYAYTDAEVTEDNTIPVGDRLPNVPWNAAGLWTSYRFQDGTLEGFKVGTGVIYEGRREARLSNTGLRLPEYVRWDAMVGYERNDWDAQVNFNNITDKAIYDTQGFYIVPQPGFNVMASLTKKFW